MAKALEHLRVLDMSRVLAGPFLAQSLADFGADVIKVERPHHGDESRTFPPYLKDSAGAETDDSAYFMSINRGKRSVTIDISKPRGQELVKALAAKSDVLIENYKVGDLERYGLHYQAIRDINPRIVYCSIAAYGQTGPYVKRVAHDMSVQAECGLLDLCRGSDGAPVMPSVPAADLAASLMALSGILMALLRRTTTGAGDYIDIGMHDSLTAWMANIVSPVFAENRELVASEERTFGGYAFYNVYRCADGKYLTMGGSEIKFAGNVLTALGRPDLIDICREPPGPAHDPVKKFLADTFATQPLAHWEAFLDKIDCCWAPVKRLREGLMSEQVAARKLKIDYPDGSSHLGIPIKFAAEPGKINPQTPALGEHTGPVLSAAGFNAAEIVQLRAGGAIR